MITDYTSLQAEVLDWLNRPDLAAKVPVFIQLAEAEMSSDVRRKTIRSTVTFNQAAFPLPADCAELRSIHLSTGTSGYDGPIDVCTPDMLAEFRTSLSASGRPRKAAVVGTDLLLVPAPDKAYPAELTYYEKLASLSSTITSNTTLTDAPDLYLKGSLLQAEAYLEHDERIPTWRTDYDNAIEQLNLQREREEYGASTKPVRLPVVFG
jgi:hypothetical protein